MLVQDRDTAANGLARQPRPGSDANPMGEPKYILGHSTAEISRLRKQAEVLRPITARLLQVAGVRPGMRVLDLGCGPGDVSFLAAELVGSSGSVVGIDRNADVIGVANERMRSAGFCNIDFKHADLEVFSGEASFDCVVGRYVLMHQADPAHFLRASAQLLRSQGIIAFHEPDLASPASSSPVVPRWDAVWALIMGAFSENLPHYDVANRIVEHFVKAGLPAPSVFREIPVGTGEHSLICGWAAQGFRGLQPQLVEMGIFPTKAVAAETVEDKLRDATLAANSVVRGPAQVGAWARI